MDGFRFSLTEEEKAFLKDLVRLSIKSRLDGEDVGIPPAPTEKLEEKYGAFVTLKRGDRLRGCIGHLIGDKPVVRTVFDMARQAAFHDPRFPELAASEFDDLDVEISILGPIVPCPDPELIEIGRHGLIMRRGAQQGLLLPQVPVEWSWDRETFLEHTCRKAGLSGDAWKKPDTQIFWFEAEVF